jgi:hypothetical protein
MSISDKLKAVVLSGILTTSSVPAMSQTPANSPQQAKPVATAQQPAQEEKSIYDNWGKVSGSFENLFTPPSFRKRIPEAVWNNGKVWAEIIKAQAAKGQFLYPQVSEGVPPLTTMMPGYPKVPTPGGALNLKQFAEYVQFSALNPDPRVKQILGEDLVFPKVIIGVITPDNTFDPRWRKRMDDVRLSVSEMVAGVRKEGDKLVPTEVGSLSKLYGGQVYEIVRVIADKNDVIFSEIQNKNLSLKDGIIITLADRGLPRIETNLLDMEIHLNSIFKSNRHAITNLELFCSSEENRKLIGKPCDSLNIGKLAVNQGTAGGNSGTGKAGGSAGGKAGGTASAGATAQIPGL